MLKNVDKLIALGRAKWKNLQPLLGTNYFDFGLLQMKLVQVKESYYKLGKNLSHVVVFF